MTCEVKSASRGSAIVGKASVISAGQTVVIGLHVPHPVGTGTARAEPEVAQITFGVELRGDDPAALVDEEARKIDGAIAAPREMGIANGDVRTTVYNLWVENTHDPETGMPTGDVAYHVSHNVQVILRDLDQVGELLVAAVVGAGANSISYQHTYAVCLARNLGGGAR
jgi:uncharacterized protein YggE